MLKLKSCLLEKIDSTVILFVTDTRYIFINFIQTFFFLPFVASKSTTPPFHPRSRKKCENVSRIEKNIYINVYTLSQKRESIVVPAGWRLSAAFPSIPPFFSHYFSLGLYFSRYSPGLCGGSRLHGISHSKMSFFCLSSEVRLVKAGERERNRCFKTFNFHKNLKKQSFKFSVSICEKTFINAWKKLINSS